MNFFSAEKLHLVLYLSIGLLILPLLTECEEIKLVGPSRCSGRVEVYNRDSWGTVCDDHWSLANADVVCRELNCGTALEAKKDAFFGEGGNMIWLDDVQCVGNEPTILKCPHRPFGENNCGHGEDAGVICSEHVRLVNGTSRCAGRVEVYQNSAWKQVCSSDWDRADAEVVCREIDCGTPVTQPQEPFFGEARVTVGVKSNCVGNESSISQCTLVESGDTCSDAVVVCAHSKPIRFMNGTNKCSGRVEIFHDGQWGTICDDRWGLEDATVACREMDCGSAISVRHKSVFGRGSNQEVWLDDLECTGHEKSIADCPHRGFGAHDCDHSEDAGIVCSETVRLLNGTNRCSGRVEVLYNGHWGKMCNTWGKEEAAVVCRELSCGTPKESQETFGDSGLPGLTSRCTGNISSITQCSLQEIRGTCTGASLICGGDPPIRLVNGTDRCSGRVEVLHDGNWGTVCDDEWDIKDAQVVCRSMDCGTAQTAKSSAFFGQGHGDIWLDDVGCIGNETSLMHCRHPSLGENNCGHGEDAGVICSADIRLINGSNQCSGRVEFYYGGKWSPTYNVNWGMNEATVTCREMNCGDPVKFSGSFGHSNHQRGYKISCTGRELSLSQCTLREYVKTYNDRIEEVSIECSGNVKLSDGSSRCDGRVEFFDKGQWGNVCGESWDMNDANVVCKQLDCGTTFKLTTLTEYGHGSGQTWIDQIECNGHESSLSQCRQTQFRERTCNATRVAGVVCTGSLEVRLANGKDECTGRVEVRHGDNWQTVCDTDWTLSKAALVCEQLECGNAVNAPGSAHYGQGSGSVVEASDACFENVTSLRQCSKNGFSRGSCGHDRDAGVSCAAQIRLVNGIGQCSGRVEVYYKGQWGTVCDDEWGMTNADVVCRQMGCGHAVSAPGSAHFDRGSGPIWLDNVVCRGEESALSHCNHHKFGENNCGHGEDAGAICLGALQKPTITVSPSSDVKWGERVEITCTVVTEHFGGTFVLKRMQDSFKLEKFSENEAATFVFTNADFNQKGSYFCEYRKQLASQVIYYPQGNVAELSVSVKIDTPTISLTSPYSMVIYSPDKISVSQGSSFSITCSIHSNYPGGSFNLMKSDNTSITLPAQSHFIFRLAYFEFSEVESKIQGTYNCIYHVNISSRNFSSPGSKSLQINVTPSSSTVVTASVVSCLLVLVIVLVVGFLVWRRRSWDVGALVQFSNRFGGTIKDDFDDRNNVAFDGRSRNTEVNEHALSPVREDNNADVDKPTERVPEDLAGKVCYENEPLFLS